MASYLMDKNTQKEKGKDNNNKESEVEVLTILEKSAYNNELPEETFEIPSNLDVIPNNLSSNNITLFNALYNSLINKDHKSFLFCIEQSNQILIEETVKQMTSDCVGKFLEKALNIFQSNSFYIKKIMPWMKMIINYQKISILSSKNNVENLAKIQQYINDKIKCFNALCLLKQKMKKVNEVFCTGKKEEEKNEKFFRKKGENEKNRDTGPSLFEPLLTYYESEDEDEKMENEKRKNKMEEEGFEEANDENNGEDEEMEEEENGNEKEKTESEEDDYDEEIDNMEIEEKDKIKNKKKLRENQENLGDEEEENEDDNEEDD